MVKLPGLLACLLLLSGCLGMPENAAAVRDFDLQRYLGTWYEIARLDHRFERGLTGIQADYSLRDDGGVRVLNSGYDIASGERKTAEGKAYFIGDPNVGRLKVSFFGPFYGAYNIIELDPDYRYAMIIGPDTDYLWILAREPQLDPAILQRLIDKAAALGAATDELIFPAHETT
ncbi:MAG: lipocalin family protein [Gammaproteobacteria bacterium]|nr:lipocalin family protein [Gammaproteobacteria bacterium]NNM20859.1 lipocalin [Gammaproteobacteria bacterium]